MREYHAKSPKKHHAAEGPHLGRVTLMGVQRWCAHLKQSPLRVAVPHAVGVYHLAREGRLFERDSAGVPVARDLQASKLGCLLLTARDLEHRAGPPHELIPDLQ